uniref:G_PROTEIN_RECEP_F1_2 domain-containing protein n=1 Tax=Panagrellus redivivus TaxID=6233 RepID=A0A7E4VCW7_PANRE
MEATCENNAAISAYFWIHIVSLIDITFTLLSIIFGVIIAVSLCVFFTLWSVCMLGVQLFHQYQWRFGGPCAAVLIRWQCLAIRAPTLVAVIGFSFNHLLFCIDRALATFRPLQYEKLHSIHGILGVAFVWLIALGTSYWTFYDNDMTRVYPYCIVTAQASGPRLQMIYLCQIGFNLCVLLGDAALKKLGNRRAKIRDQNISPGRYALGEQIQLRENQITTAWLFPFAILHTTVFLSFLIVTSIYRTLHTDPTMTPQHITTLEGLHSLVCIYVFCAYLINLRVYVRLYKEREIKVASTKIDNNADVYFQMFSKQISNVTKIV